MTALGAEDLILGWAVEAGIDELGGGGLPPSDGIRGLFCVTTPEHGTKSSACTCIISDCTITAGCAMRD